MMFAFALALAGVAVLGTLNLVAARELAGIRPGPTGGESSHEHRT